ncbi:MAG: hypothetical protein IJM54_08140 [Thermoguttaceae bacterium]|nr:hypothetical protein [Thermoguttaceae bacterium]
MKKIVIATLCVLLAVASTSCKKEKRPDGMPDIYPCSLKIVQDSAPLADAQVSIVSSDPQIMRFPCGGNTDANGIVELKTMGFKGAPAGSFKVVVSKIEATNRPSSYEEAQQLQEQGAKEESFDLVDRKYADASTTPLSIEVQKSNPAPIELDVGEAVRISREDLMR